MEFPLRLTQMSFSLYNTLSGQKEEFKPIEPNKVGMYVCGPTVYDYDHIGHARTYLSFDLLNRYLDSLGYHVTYIQNITDVGHLLNDAESGTDKIQKKAQDSGQTTQQVVDHFTEAHLVDLKALNIKMPSNLPRASQTIKEIIEFTKELINKGFAYVSKEGNVYFSVAKDPQYGKLSHRGLTEILTGTRVEPAADKRSPADFALWKAAPLSVNEMVWDSPWVRGYPGWHIECSVMSRKFLGDTFDIHGSAVEHIFPHHENEIAQTESLTGKPMANYWVHSGMLTINGQKMSKSLHNTVLVQEALKTYTSNEIRLAYYQTHYRKPFDYQRESLLQGVALRQKLFSAYTNLPEKTDMVIWSGITDALNDDLDTAKALQLWGENTKLVNGEDTDKLFNIFGLTYTAIKDNMAASKLAKERDEARTNQDYLTADNRKAEIVQHGYDVLDTANGTVYIPR